MVNILSKLLMNEWSFPYNCYEVGHTWTPNCTEAALGIGFTVFRESLKMYFSLYMVSQGMGKKFDITSFKQTLLSTLRSSLFLSLNAYSAILLFCGVRRVSGKFYYSLCAYFPAFIASYAAILVERPSRRNALAIYVINIASETLFRIGVSRGYIKPIPKGEVLLFTLSISALMYLIKSNGFASDPVSMALKFIVGREEGKSRQPLADGQLCPHPANLKCQEYVARGFLKSFALAYLGQTALSAAFKPTKFMNDPMSALLSPQNIKFGVFLGLFTSVYKATNCFLRQLTGENKPWFGLVGGLLSGPMMFFSPNTTMTLYITWKAIESMFCVGVKNGTIKYPNLITYAVYAFGTAQLFYSVVLEPRHIRPSYMKFIDRVTDHKMHLLNRNILDIFGTQASAGYEEYFPNLDPRHTSRQFKETVLLWVL